MSSSEIKERIVSSYVAGTPDILERIKAECEEITQAEYMGVPEAIKSTGIRWKQLTAMVAALLIVSAISMQVGRLSSPSSKMEMSSVDNSETAGENTLLQQAGVELEIGSGIKLKVDENLKISDITCQDKNLEKKLLDKGIVGMEVEAGLKLIREQTSGSIDLKKDENKTSGNKKESKNVKVSDPKNTTVNPEQEKQEIKSEGKQESKPEAKKNEKQKLDNKENLMDMVEGEVKKDLNQVEQITDTSTNIVEDVVDTSTDIVKDVTDTTTNVIGDVTDTTSDVIHGVEDSINQIFNIFK